MTRVRHIFRWDLDKTYLKTEFDTVRDLVRTARTPAELRQNIPGSAALLRTIRASAPPGHLHQIFFISGSPSQMRGVLERKFAIDGFAPDGFTLKPTVGHFLRGRFRAIRGQVAYKLAELLQGRAEAPIGTEETLFGDDAETDAFIYSLYSDLVAGDISRDTLRAVLRKAGAYADQIEQIEMHLEAIVHERPVRRILIHLDQQTPPAAFSPYFPLLVPIYNHLQTAIVLDLDETLGPPAIRDVAIELLGAYGFDVQRLANLAEDILRRVRARYPVERLERMAQELPTLEVEATKPEVAKATTQLLGMIADRARHLVGRPLPEEPERSTPARDYLQLLDEDRERKEALKRSRKEEKPAPSRGGEKSNTG